MNYDFNFTKKNNKKHKKFTCLVNKIGLIVVIEFIEVK